MDPHVFDILETKSILNREYVSHAQMVLLSLVYYPETKVDFHAPEACLAGKGIQISKSEKTIEIIKNSKNQGAMRLTQIDIFFNL